MLMLRALFSAVLLTVVGLSSPVHAASIVAWDVPTLTNESSIVVDATVESVVSTRQDDGMITTRVELRVHEGLKGNTGRTLVVHQIGGTVGDWTLTMPGAMQFVEGQRLVLFALEQDGRVYPTLFAWSGFIVEGSGPTAPIRRTVEGLTLFDMDEQGVLRPVENPVAAPKTLDALRSTVLQTVQGSR